MLEPLIISGGLLGGLVEPNNFYPVAQEVTPQVSFSPPESAEKARIAAHKRRSDRLNPVLANTQASLNDSDQAALQELARGLVESISSTLPAEEARLGAHVFSGELAVRLMVARRALMSVIDTNAALISTETKRQAQASAQGLETDITVIGGAGWHGSVFTTALLAQNPNLRTTTIDGGKLGGQFRSYGTRAAFGGNSRNHRPFIVDEPSLPGGIGTLNPMGKNAVIHFAQFTGTTGFKPTDLGDGIATNGFVGAENMMLDSNVVGLRDIRQKGARAPLWQTIAIDNETGQEHRTVSPMVVIPAGLSRKFKFADAEKYKGTDNLYSWADVIRMFADETNNFPMNPFIGKRIGIIGSKDSGINIAKLLCRLAPEECYGFSVSQLGGPSSIEWFGTDFIDRDSFCGANRPFNHDLGQFIVRDSQNPQLSEIIRPNTEKVQNLSQRGNGTWDVQTGTTTSTVDIVIDCAREKAIDPALLSEDESLRRDQPVISYDPIRGVADLLDGVEVARRIAPGVFTLGPIALLKLTQRELATYSNSDIGENIVSGWANVPRTEAFAQLVGKGRRV